MYAEFDFNVQSGLLAVRTVGLYGGTALEIRDLSGGLVHEIGQSFVPQGPRISPNGRQLAFFGSSDHRLYVHDIEAAATRTVLQDWGVHTGFCEWSPDGRSLVFSSVLDGQPPSICCIHLDDGIPFRLTDGPGTADRFPQWSSTGDSVACIRQYMDEPGRPSHICVVDVHSGETRDISLPEHAWHQANRFCWSPDASHILITEQIGERITIHAIRLDDMQPVWSYATDTLHGGAFTPDGRSILCVCRDELLWASFPDGAVQDRLPLSNLAPVRNTLTGRAVALHPDSETAYFLGENSVVYRWDIGSGCTPVLQEPAMPMPEFTEEEYRITARDGRSIPVHRYTPPNPKPTAVLFAIGGPGGTVNASGGVVLRLIAEGHEVIAPSYRGCAGYGPEHEDANIGEYGRADVWDIVDVGLDWKRRTGGDRPLALIGQSYGGYLTLLALTQPDSPWACAIALWPVTTVMRPHEQRWFPQDAEEKARAMIERSPVEQAIRIHSPLLILHGSRDTTTSDHDVTVIEQKVIAAGFPCKLTVFADDTHGLNKHRDEMYRAMFHFLEEFA